MSDFEKRYDQIEAYLKGKLSGAEKDQFEIELAQDSGLREEVEMQKVARTVIEQAYLQDISAIIKEQSNQKPSYWKWIVVGLVSVVGISTITFVLNEPQNTDAIIAENKVVDKVSPVIEVAQKKTPSEMPSKEAVVSPDAEKEKKQVVEFKQEKSSQEDSSWVIQEPISIKEVEIKEEKPAAKLIESVTVPITKSTVECKQPRLMPIKTIDCHLGEEDGELILDQSKKLEYKINASEFSAYVETRNLAAGKYDVKARDENNCIYDLGVYEIHHGNCLKETNYSFNLAYNDVLTLPIKERINTEISILNKLGQTVFIDKVDNATSFEWNGRYTDGSEASMGIHKLIVKQNQNTCLYNVIISK